MVEKFFLNPLNSIIRSHQNSLSLDHSSLTPDCPTPFLKTPIPTLQAHIKADS